MSQEAYLRVQDLSLDLAEFHLRDINLDVRMGEFLVILGPTGAGKTVLLETIAGLYPPRRGRVFLEGNDATRVPPERRGIGFVYQDYALFPHLRVAGNIAFGLKLRHAPRERIRKQVSACAEMLGIEHLLHRWPDTLSGGEQQRVALARALVVEPKLLLLDEPFSALDPETREGLQREVTRLQRELGTPAIQVTHDFEEAVAMGDRIAIMNQGRIVQTGSAEDVFRRPSTEFVARFVGMRNILHGQIERAEDDTRLIVDGIALWVVTGLSGQAHGSVRPEDILISRERLHSSARNSFRGRIVDIEDRGSLVYVTVRVPPDFSCAITRRSVDELALRPGQEVYIAFKASAVHVF